MRILLTGATGFIGRHVLKLLLRRGHSITAIVRPGSRQTDKSVAPASLIEADLQEATSYKEIPFEQHDVLCHLAWSHLQDYRDPIHLSTLLPAHLRFLQTAIQSGLPQLFVAGTCFEYGLQEGCLNEQTPSAPVLPYAEAKDRLRSQLEELTKNKECRLQWGRLFYMYGEGQSHKSLIAQLDKAIDDGEPTFNMSGGEQVRDYLPVEEVSGKIVQTLETPQLKGIINICSGKPVPVKELVKKHLHKRGAKIGLNLGHYPYPDYEPIAYWGDGSKLKNFVSAYRLHPSKNNHA